MAQSDPLELFSENTQDPLGLFGENENDPLGLFPEKKSFTTKVLDTAESTARVAGAVGGSLVAFPAGGVVGAVKGVGQMIEDAPDIKNLITGKEKLTPEQEDELLNNALDTANENIERISGFPLKLIKTPGQEKAIEILFKPMEWVDTAGKFYGDWAYEKTGDGDIAASVKTSFEIAAFFGLPKLFGKLKAQVKAGKLKEARATAIRIQKEKLKSLRAEPKRLEVLANAERNIKAMAEFEKSFPVKKAAESAQVFLDEMAKPQTGFGKKVLKTEMMSKAEFQGQGQVAPGMKKPYVPPTELPGRGVPKEPVLPNVEAFTQRATEGVGGKFVSQKPVTSGPSKRITRREGYKLKETVNVEDPLGLFEFVTEGADKIKGEFGEKIKNRSVEPIKEKVSDISKDFADIIQNDVVAIKLPGEKVLKGKYSEGGHTEIINRMTPKQTAKLGEAKEGVMTHGGKFVERKPGVEPDTIFGKNVSDIKDSIVTEKSKKKVNVKKTEPKEKKLWEKTRLEWLTETSEAIAKRYGKTVEEWHKITGEKSVAEVAAKPNEWDMHGTMLQSVIKENKDVIPKKVIEPYADAGFGWAIEYAKENYGYSKAVVLAEGEPTPFDIKVKDKLEGVGNIKFITKLVREEGKSLSEAGKIVEDFRYGKISEKKFRSYFKKPIEIKDSIVTEKPNLKEKAEVKNLYDESSIDKYLEKNEKRIARDLRMRERLSASHVPAAKVGNDAIAIGKDQNSARLKLKKDGVQGEAIPGWYNTVTKKFITNEEYFNEWKKFGMDDPYLAVRGPTQAVADKATIVWRNRKLAKEKKKSKLKVIEGKKTRKKTKKPTSPDDTLLSFMGTEQAYKLIKNELPKLKKASEVAHKIVDVEAPFIKLGAAETGFHVKNYFTKRALVETEGPIVGKKIAETVDYNKAKLGYKMVLAAESKKALKASTKDIRKGARILHDYFEKSKGEYAKRGIRIDYKKRIIAEIEAKILNEKDIKKSTQLRKLLNKARDLEFVHIPSALWFENKLGGPEGAKSVLKILGTQKRKSFNIKSLVDAGIIKAEDIKVSDILASYSRRKGRDFALLDIVDAAVKDKLAIRIKKGVKIPDNFVDVPNTAPVLRGNKIHPVMYDYIRDITGKGLDLGKFQTVLSLSKMAAFINPLILPMYDAMQHSMLAVTAKWSGKSISKNTPGYYLAQGIRDYLKKSPEYYEAFSEGLFSKPYNNPFQSLQKLTDWSMKNKQQKMLRILQAVYPWKTIQSIYNASWHIAWEMDQAIRMSSYRLLRDKGLSPRDAAQVGALFHGDYAGVPAKLRRIANIPFFTPTFKIAMGKLYIQMLKGAVETPAKAIILKKNSKGVYTKRDISPRMKFYAAGLAGLVIANTAKNLIMNWHGYETDQWGRRWKKTVLDEDGKNVESMVTFSDPSNIAQKYIFRSIQSFAPEKEKPIIEFISANRWEIHPLWRSMVEALTNKNAMGEKIYSIAEAGSAEQYKKQAWYITKNIVRLLGSFDPEQHDKKGLEILERETNRAMAVAVKLLAFTYVRNPEGVSKALKLKRFHNEFRQENLHKAIKGEKIDPELIKKYDKKIEQLKE